MQLLAYWKIGSTFLVGLPLYDLMGGPQFLGPFKAWCEHNNILHELSSPYNPRGNGLAEAAVKNVKQNCSFHVRRVDIDESHANSEGRKPKYTYQRN